MHHLALVGSGGAFREPAPRSWAHMRSELNPRPLHRPVHSAGQAPVAAPGHTCAGDSPAPASAPSRSPLTRGSMAPERALALGRIPSCLFSHMAGPRAPYLPGSSPTALAV